MSVQAAGSTAASGEDSTGAPRPERGVGVPMAREASEEREAVTQRGPTVEERIASRRERVHVLTGAVCNNNCIFCMEEDREGRYVTNSATTDEVVRWILRSSQGAEEICFTSGEPTTNPRLPQWVRWAREAGYPRVSVMTNGRACSYERYTRMLVAAGMNRFYVSIHGHEARLHEGLTRTPGSFEQTVEGIRQIARYVPRGIELHTSTVVTRRNLPFMGDIYRFLRSLGVQQVVFNVMQANGRAHTYFEKIFPRYSEIARTARDFLEAQGRLEQPVQAFLVDIPLCTTTELPDYNRGYVEAYVHYEPPVGAHDVPLRPEHSRCGGNGPDGDLVAIRRSDLDHAARTKRAECSRCRYDPVCEGVWVNYLRRYGWDEMQPVPL
ncbi:MAG: radical SAM protein HxsC4 [Myxococcales bacterium]|nr:radical SAM protein HxsC4 [Myxococcales bacterium]